MGGRKSPPKRGRSTRGKKSSKKVEPESELELSMSGEEENESNEGSEELAYEKGAMVAYYDLDTGEFSLAEVFP